ncbi:MAG TPA: response regulator [Verrucomicrobiae bacterium]|nr:response regulator [Verrucomicrobiae bacterium]
MDDDARNLDVLESVLASPGVILIRAQTSDEALLRLIESPFAAIVLDVQMPDTNGLELARLIKQRKQSRDIPIIFMTAFYLENEDVLSGYRVGAADYLLKPFNPLILKSKISVFVDLFRKNIELAQANRNLEKAEEAMKQANNMLEGRVQERTAELVLANRAKDDFLAMLSHELRTPLGPALLLASESADDPGIPEILRRRFHAIAKYVELEARLIDDLLDLTRIANGKLHLERRPVVVHSAIEDALAIVEEEIKKKQICVSISLTAEHCVISCDPTRVRQIFWNVIKNAIKFTPENGKISVKTSSDAGSGRLSVKVTDTGIGMSEKEIGSIFDAFSQGDFADLEKHRFGGLGLGLTIARRLVELQSGTIRAESPGRNQGATFTIEFPYLKPAENQIPALLKPVAVPTTAKRSLSILLVEDDKLTQDTLVQLLTRREHRVIVAGSLTEARHVSCNGKFDVVLSDVGLPDGTGYTLMAELRDNFGLKGIALTGYGTGQDIVNAKKAGFVTHLTKPIHVESLENALSQFH